MNPRILITLILGSVFFAAPAHAQDAPTYERDIKPILEKRCNVCHNAGKVDHLDISAGLALDSFESAIKGTKDHHVIIAGDSAKSELFKRLTTKDEDLRMPLSDKPLLERDQMLIKRWIDAGAVRGDPVAASANAGSGKPRARRIVRALDIVIPIEVKVPPNTKGLEPGGSAQLALKVGPLPSVSALSFRGDGRLLAVGTNGAVVLWDLVDGRPARILTDVPGPVHALAFTRDGKRLAVGSGLPARTGSIRIYSVPDGTLTQEFTGHGEVVFGLAFRPDGAQLASASLDQTVRFWDLTRSRPAGVFRGHSDFVYDVAYDGDGKSVLSVSKDQSVKRIDVIKIKELRTYSNHNNDVLAVAVQPRGDRFVTAGAEPQLRWWSAEDEEPKKRIGGHNGPVHQLAFSGNGAKLISAGGDGSVRLWDGRSGSFEKSLPGPSEWQYAVALSDDAALAAAAGWDGLVRVWDTKTAKLRATLLQPPGDAPDQVEWLAITPSGYYSASAGLAKQIRWRIGGKDVTSDAPRQVFDKPNVLAQALRGETIAPSFK